MDNVDNCCGFVFLQVQKFGPGREKNISESFPEERAYKLSLRGRARS